jgi:hypothetical protein
LHEAERSCRQFLLEYTKAADKVHFTGSADVECHQTGAPDDPVVRARMKMPRTPQTTGKSSRGTSKAAPPSGAAQKAAGSKPKSPARPAAASKGQKRTSTKSATAVPVRAPLKARQAKPKRPDRSAVPKRTKKPKKNDKVRARRVNAACFLLLLLAVSVWAEIHRDKLTPLVATLGTVTGLSILLSFLRYIPKRAISWIGETVTDRLMQILESRRITPYLAVLAALGLPLAGLESYLHHRSYAILIVEGSDLLGVVRETSADLPPKRFTLVFKVTEPTGDGGQVQRAAMKPLTGAGRIYAGSEERYLRWHDRQPEAKEQYEDFKQRALLPMKDNGNDKYKDEERVNNLKRFWDEPVQFMPPVNVRLGDKISVQLVCTRNEMPLIETTRLLTLKDPKLLLIELDPPQDPQKHKEFSTKVAECNG